MKKAWSILILTLFLMSDMSIPIQSSQSTSLSQPTVCVIVSDGAVCMDYLQNTVTTTPSPTSSATPTFIPTETMTSTPTLTPINTFTPTITHTPSPTLNTLDQYTWDLMEHASTPVLGSVPTSWLFPGIALTASTYKIYGNFLQGREVILASWVLVWNPNTGPSPTGVRLVKFDDGPANIQEIARVDMSNYNSPTVSGGDITAAIGSILDNGEYKHLGHQTYGNGSSGCLIYSSVIYIVLK